MKWFEYPTKSIVHFNDEIFFYMVGGYNGEKCLINLTTAKVYTQGMCRALDLPYNKKDAWFDALNLDRFVTEQEEDRKSDEDYNECMRESVGNNWW